MRATTCSRRRPAGTVDRGRRRSRRPTCRHRDQTPAASGACSASPSPPTATCAYVNYTDDDGDTVVAEYAVARRRHVRRGQPSGCCSRSTSPTRTTTAAISRSVPTACSTSASATAGRAAIPSGGRSDLDHAARQAPAHRPDAVRRPAVHDPRRQPVRRRRRARAARDLVDRAAQPVAVHVRPGHRRPVDRRRRPERGRGDRRRRRRPAGIAPAGRQLRVERLRGQRPLQRRPVRRRAPRRPGVRPTPTPTGCSITGGARRTAARRSPALAAATCTATTAPGEVWAFDRRRGGATSTAASQPARGRRVTAVRAGPDGELYVLERRRRRALDRIGAGLSDAQRDAFERDLGGRRRRRCTSRTLISSPGSTRWASTRADDRRIGDLELDAPVVLVDRRPPSNSLAFATRRARPPRRGRAPPLGPVGALLAPRHRLRQRLERRRDRRRGPARRWRPRARPRSRSGPAGGAAAPWRGRRSPRPRRATGAGRRGTARSSRPPDARRTASRNADVRGSSRRQRAHELGERHVAPATRARTPARCGADGRSAVLVDLGHHPEQPGPAASSASATARLVGQRERRVLLLGRRPRPEPQRRSRWSGSRHDLLLRELDAAAHRGAPRRRRSGGAARRSPAADRPRSRCRRRAWPGCARSPARRRRGAPCRRAATRTVNTTAGRSTSGSRLAAAFRQRRWVQRRAPVGQVDRDAAVARLDVERVARVHEPADVGDRVVEHDVVARRRSIANAWSRSIDVAGSSVTKRDRCGRRARSPSGRRAAALGGRLRRRGGNSIRDPELVRRIRSRPAVIAAAASMSARMVSDALP